MALAPHSPTELHFTTHLALDIAWKHDGPTAGERNQNPFNLFYTDDAALFSAPRRLNLHGDPTQPVIDTELSGKGSDMVFEPHLDVTKSFASRLGRNDLLVRSQAFVYAVRSRRRTIPIVRIHS